MIPVGEFAQCIRQGVYFSVDNDDRLFTGDLFYDIARRDFQLRGIPSVAGRKTHAIPVTERGPFLINLYVMEVILESPRTEGNYVDLRFRKAKASTNFMTWLEEWYGDHSVMGATDEFWTVEGKLAWVRGA